MRTSQAHVGVTMLIESSIEDETDSISVFRTGGRRAESTMGEGFHNSNGERASGTRR